ncbi:HEAT repeat domain-containing protein [Clostridium sp. E14]|uniref:PBS lyase n=1 Tax=Clostridium omnivorum TaxID=1604902 RepID=A0ABQ5N0B6_9CLOT|nr:PBS lyase [Clostridium sp. E14]
MSKGLIKIDWNKAEEYANEDISYFLFLEGKPIDAICKIRNLEKVVVQEHLIKGKIKYRFLAKSKDERELFNSICNAGKLDKINLLNSIDQINQKALLSFIRRNYTDMLSKDKECAVWIVGELKDKDYSDILLKALVHKHVNIRRMAVSAMGKMELTSFEGPLIRSLDDENPQVVQYAIKALTKLKSKNALKRIETIYTLSDKQYIKNAAKEFMDRVSN